MKIDNWQKRELFGLLFWGFIGLVVMILVMSLAGCGSSKSNLRQELSVKENFNHTRNDSTSVSKEVTKTETEKSTEETEEVIIEYDTSKPIDSATGKPPIKSETKKNTKKEIGKKADIKENTQTNTSSDEQTYAKKEEDVTMVEDRQKFETTVPKQIGGIVWAVIALILVAVATWLIIHYKLEKGDN